MRIVVTGGCGFIGSNFIKSLLNKGKYQQVINVDSMTYAANPLTAKALEKYSNYRFIQADICDPLVMKDVIQRDDVVVNFAAESHVDRSIADQSVFLKTNILGVQNLLDVIRKKHARVFVQVSTDEVYGSLEFDQKSSTEIDRLCPSSPYSASKAAAEMICMSAARTFGLPIIMSRSSNNFGPYQFPEKIIPLFITNLLNDKKVPVYGRGLNVRDWIYVEDNCEAIQMLVDHGVHGEIYNIGGGNEVKNIDLTRLILKLMNKDESNISYVADRLGHDLRYSLDCSKIHKIGWSPKKSFAEGLQYTIDWYAKHPLWWKSVVRN